MTIQKQVRVPKVGVRGDEAPVRQYDVYRCLHPGTFSLVTGRRSACVMNCFVLPLLQQFRQSATYN